jgi:simple sugar transport system permease protein
MTAPVIAPEIGEPTVVQVRAMKVPITLLVLAGLLGILFLLAPATASPRSTRRSRGGDRSGRREHPALPVVGVWAIATALAVVSFVAARRYRPVGLWLPIVYAVLAMVAFLTWAGAGASGAITLVGLLGGSISLAVPLVFGALGGVIGERSASSTSRSRAVPARRVHGDRPSSITQNPFVGLSARCSAVSSSPSCWPRSRSSTSSTR